jgi:hypothetical protein
MPETPNRGPAVNPAVKPALNSAVNPGDAPADPMAMPKLLGAWLFVGIPAAWGIWQVFQKSLALFK